MGARKKDTPVWLKKNQCVALYSGIANGTLNLLNPRMLEPLQIEAAQCTAPLGFSHGCPNPPNPYKCLVGALTIAHSTPIPVLRRPSPFKNSVKDSCLLRSVIPCLDSCLCLSLLESVFGWCLGSSMETKKRSRLLAATVRKDNSASHNGFWLSGMAQTSGIACSMYQSRQRYKLETNIHASGCLL